MEAKKLLDYEPKTNLSNGSVTTIEYFDPFLRGRVVPS
jgi:hypothetical protein